MRAIIGIALCNNCCGIGRLLERAVDSGCRSFKPIGWSKADTEPTKRAVVAHNKVFDAICPNS